MARHLLAMAIQHAVGLVPGFLGFNHAGQVTYFADRLVGGLRAAIEATSRKRIEVVPLDISPIGSLAERQVTLIRAIEKYDAKKGGHRLWHLVGHSTGGLDAALLARGRKLTYDPDVGTERGEEKLYLPFGPLASVTTISAPHYGTCLALAPLPASTRAGQVSLEERFAGLKELPHLAFEATFNRDALGERLSFSHGAAFNSSVDFFWHLLFNDKLARDLDPNRATELTSPDDDGAVPIFSIATVTPPPSQDPNRDHLFDSLWGWTRLKAIGAQPAAPRGPAPARVIGQVPEQFATLGGIPDEANDGVVNTNRQIVGKFAALVWGDHGDVLGRYRRLDALDGNPLDPGLLTSGANFGDDQFFELMRVIAEGIAGVM